MRKRHIPRKKRIPGVRILIVILLIGVLMIIYGVFSFNSSRWDGKRRFTVAVLELTAAKQSQSGVALFTIEPRTQQALYLSIPPDLLLDVPYGYNTYRTSAVYQMGNLDSARGGGMLLAKSIESTLGVSVEGHLASDMPLAKRVQSKEALIEVKHAYFTLFRGWRVARALFSTGIGDTNLSAVDAFRLWHAISSLRVDQIGYIDLASGAVYDTVTLPDGTERKMFNADVFDGIIGDSFQDADIRSEQLSVEVVNATDQSLLATHFGLILQRLGTTVVAITNAKEQQMETCRVSVAENSVLRTHTVQFLQRVYHCSVEKEATKQRFSDIMVTLGKEFTQ